MLDHAGPRRGFEGAGGTTGGVGEFILGFVLSIAGGYLLTNQVMVTTGFWHWWGYSAFGLTLIPLVIGVAWLFFDGRSMAGRLLTIAGGVIILAGVISHLEIYFRPTSLFNTLVMLVMLFGGLGLVLRSLRPHGPRSAVEKDSPDPAA